MEWKKHFLGKTEKARNCHCNYRLLRVKVVIGILNFWFGIFRCGSIAISDFLPFSLHIPTKSHVMAKPAAWLRINISYWKCIFPMNHHVRRLVGWSVLLLFGWLVCQLVIIPFKGRAFTLPCFYRSTYCLFLTKEVGLVRLQPSVWFLERRVK